MQNYFELFALKTQFDIDLTALEKAYQAKIAQFHPDKFATQTPQQKSRALQNTSLLNSAFDTLKSPLMRATYLLQLQNIDAFDEKNTQMDTVFLIQQIEYREALEQLGNDENANEIEVFIGKINVLKQRYIANIATNFKDNKLAEIKNLVRELKFFEQLKQQANTLMDKYL